jgi:hypothetical protein
MSVKRGQFGHTFVKAQVMFKELENPIASIHRLPLRAKLTNSHAPWTCFADKTNERVLLETIDFSAADIHVAASGRTVVVVPTKPNMRFTFCASSQSLDA